MNAFAQKEGLPGMGYIFWREKPPMRRARTGIRQRSQAKMKSGEVEGGMEAAGPWPRTSDPSVPRRSASSLGLTSAMRRSSLGGKPKAFEGVAGRARNVIGPNWA